MGRSSEAKNPKNPKKVKCDGPTDGRTDGPTDGPTKRGVESRSTRLKTMFAGMKNSITKFHFFFSRVEKSDYFTRKGADVHTEAHISLAQVRK